MNADPVKTWEAKVLPHGRQILGCAVSRDGNHVAAGDFDGQIQLWNLTNDEKTTLSAHRTWVQALAFHPDGRRLFSTDYWGVVHCWPFTEANARPSWSIAEAHQGWIRAAIVSPDGNHLVTGGNDGAVRIWSTTDGKKVRELTGHESQIFALVFHPNGHLVSGDQHGVLKEWDLQTGRAVRDLDAKTLWHSAEETMSLCGLGGVRGLSFNHDGSLLFVGGMGETTSSGFAAGKPHAMIFDWATGQSKTTLQFKEPYEGFVTSFAWHPDGYIIGAGGGVGGQLWFWRPNDAIPFHTVKQLRHIREMHLHPDGLRIVTACFEAKGAGGNGRNQALDQYTDNAGAVRVFSMTQKPTPAKK